jgi:16S rRNA (cytidine1402-2'-O)-methyltransferase
METPYRNNKFLEDILNTLHPQTNLCIACDITLPTEFIKTKTVNDWKKQKADLHNRPCIFIIQKN